VKLGRRALRAHPLPPVIDGGKETKGRILVIAGSRDVPGAALLTARAAMRAGAGKLRIATVESVAIPVGVAMPERSCHAARSSSRRRRRATGDSPVAAASSRSRWSREKWARSASARPSAPGSSSELTTRSIRSRRRSAMQERCQTPFLR